MQRDGVPQNLNAMLVPLARGIFFLDEGTASAPSTSNRLSGEMKAFFSSQPTSCRMAATEGSSRSRPWRSGILSAMAKPRSQERMMWL